MKNSIKSVIGKFFKITGLSVIGILLLLFLAPILFPGHISESVKSFANKSLDGEMNFSKVRLSFFNHFPSLTVTLYDFTLKGSSPFKKDTLVSTKKIGFGINIKNLLFDNRININKIFIDNAVIKVLVNKKGAANYNVYVPAKKAIAAKNEDTAGTALKLDKIVIKDSRLLYNDQSTAIFIDAKGFNYTGNGDLSKAVFDLNSHAQIDSLDFYFDNEPYLFNKKIDGTLITSINTNSLAFYFQKNNLIINKLPVEFSGKLNFLTNGYDLDFTLNTTKANLDDLVTALPPQFVTWQQKTTIKGTTDLLLTLKGKYISSTNGMPDLIFNMKIRDGYIAYEKAPFPVTDLFLNLDTKLPSINTDSLRVKIDSVHFKVDNSYLSVVINTLGIHDPYISAKINSFMDLEKLQKAVGFEAADLKGKCEVKMEMEGKYAKGPNPDSSRKTDTIFSVPAFKLQATITDGYLKYHALPVAVTNISFNVNSSCPDNNYQHAGFSIDNISVKALNSFIKGRASVSSLGEMLLNVNLQSAINLGEIKKIYPLNQADVAGILKLNINSKGRYDRGKKIFPVTNANISLQNGLVKTTYYPDPVSDIQVAATITNSTTALEGVAIDIQPASFRFEGEPFQLQISLKNLEDIAYNIRAAGKINLAKIYKVFSRQGTDINGFIDADFSLQGKQSDAMAGHYDKLNNKGRLTVNNIRASSEYFPQPFFIKEGVFKFDQDKMRFHKFLASYGQSDIELDGYLQDVIGYALSKNASLKGNFNMHAGFINVDEFMVNAPAGSVADNTPNKDAALASKTETGVVIIPSDLNISLNAAVKKVLYNGLNIENARASILIDQSKLVLNKTGFNLAGCNVLMDAMYGSLGPARAYFESHLLAKEFDIKRAYNEVKLFHDMATAAGSAEGIISLDYSLKGFLDGNMLPLYPSLDGGGVITVKNIKMNGFKLLSAVGDKTGKDGIKNPEFSKIDIKSTIKNNVINIEQFKIKAAGFRLRIEGKTNFDGALQMKMRLGLPPLGIIGIPMRVTGTQENPVIKLGKSDKEEVSETEYEDKNDK